ncbi:MAG: serine/threonine protein kinase [Acidobacteria bacterium]|nr:serine/threonine protein kinase [Acidobacteriota bacterium]
MAEYPSEPSHHRLVLTASEGAPRRLSLTSLPAALIERGPARLAWVTLGCLVSSLAMFVMGGILQPATAAAERRLLVQVNEIALIALSAGLLIAERSGKLRPITLLRLGLVFEVLVAAGIAIFENSIPWPEKPVIRGFSPISVWVAAYILVVPMPPVLGIATGLAAATMGPLIHLSLAALEGRPPLAANLWLLYYSPAYLMVLVAGFLGARLLRLEYSVAKARELGAYELLELIARGSMGEVWRAHHRYLKRDSAIKLIRSEALLARTGQQAGVMRKRFEHEARTTASLRSPHTVELYDFGVTDEGGFYYAMELLDGFDLERLVREFGPQPPGRVVHILSQACISLDEAHGRGLVHRDVKPTNFYLCRLGIEPDFVKLLDFGLVKLLAPEESAHVTLDGHITGTPAFLAPELALGEEQVDGRADIYGLGCVAYWLLTGQVVFDERTPTATAMAHVRKEPPPPSARTDHAIPAGLEAIVMACLAKKPADRPPSAAELRRMLARCPDVPAWTFEDAERWWRTVRPGTA